MKRTVVLCGAVLLLVGVGLPFSLSAQSQSFSEPTFDLGASAGLWAGGDVYLGWPDDHYEKDGSFLFRAFIDGYVVPTFAAGAYVNISSVNIGYFDIDATMFEFGGAFKPRFMLSPEAAIKPGLNIGYRSVSSDTETAEHEGLGVNLSVELQYQPESLKEQGLYLFLDTGFLSQPAGGNDDQDITFAPIFYIAAGVGI
mgnify:CR=1 FL=1